MSKRDLITEVTAIAIFLSHFADGQWRIFF